MSVDGKNLKLKAGLIHIKDASLMFSFTISIVNST